MDKTEMKQKICVAIDASRADIEAYADSVFNEPELGFKEVKTAAKLAAQFDKLGISYETGLAFTGIKLGSRVANQGLL